MIRDRGRMKWVSMMLPEHVKILREWAEEDTYETRKELDEQQLELINETIAEAIEYKRAVTIIHYRGKQYELLVGTIKGWDSLSSMLYVVDRFEKEHRIVLQNIMDVQWTDV